MKKLNKSIGDYGENIACNYLKNKNHIIKDRNFRFHKYEVDIVSIYNGILIFTEVKSRYNKKYGMPVTSVNYIKKNYIKSTANYYIYIKNLYNLNIRFDIIEILFNYNDNSFLINHIENAFT